MDLGALELQIFVSLVVVLGSAFVALVCDYLKGNNEQLRERNIELRVRTEEQERFAILNPSAWLSQFRGTFGGGAARPGRAAPVAAEAVMKSHAPEEGLADAAHREAVLAQRSADDGYRGESGVASVPEVAEFDVAERRSSRRKRGSGDGAGVTAPGSNSYDWIRPEVMARVARGAGSRASMELDSVSEPIEAIPTVAAEAASLPTAAWVEAVVPKPVPEISVAEPMAAPFSQLTPPVPSLQLQTEIERVSRTDSRPAASAPPVIMLRPLPSLRLNEELQRISEAAVSENNGYASQLLEDVIAASDSKSTPVAVEPMSEIAELRIEPIPEIVAGAHRAEAYLAGAQGAGVPRAGTERAEAELAGGQRAEVQRAGSERAEAELAGGQRAGSQRAEAERAEVQRAGTQSAEAERAEVQRAGSEHAEVPWAGRERVGTERGEVPWAGTERAESELAEVEPVLEMAPSFAVAEPVQESIYTSEPQAVPTVMLKTQATEVEERPFPSFAFEPSPVAREFVPQSPVFVESAYPAFVEVPALLEFPTYDALPPVVETPAYDWAHAEYAPQPETVFASEAFAAQSFVEEGREEMTVFSAVVPVGFHPVVAPEPVSPSIAELLLPTGMQDLLTYRHLLGMPNPMSGIVITIGINDHARLASTVSAQDLPGLLGSVETLMGSMVREGDFGVKVSDEQWVFVYRIDSQGFSQRRVSGLSEKLWDFQLRHLGLSNLSFSWAALNVNSERLEVAVTAAIERMESSRRGSKKPSVDRARLLVNG